MTFASTLGLYITRTFMGAVLAVLAALSGLVALFDFIDLLRRAGTRPNVGLGVVTEIASLRLPWLAMSILPFAVLLGGMLAFWRLTRSSELIVARASGVSAWQFLAGPVLCGVLLGVLATTAGSPLSAVMLARAETLENIYLSTGGGPLALNGGQLWLRQADHGLVPHGVAILHARGVVLAHGQLTARDVSVFRLDGADRFLARIEARGAVLGHGAWHLHDARVIRADRLPAAPHLINLPTDLTVSRVEESFASPDTLSFWVLPGFIRLLQRSGFSAIQHRLHYQTLLALPLLCGTMVLVGAGFSMRPARRGGVAQMAASGVASGFLLFLISKVAEQFGDSGALPPELAAWAPAAAGLMLAVALLLHLEDG